MELLTVPDTAVDVAINSPLIQSRKVKKPANWPADKIERRKVDDLIPYARNARTHSDEQVAQLAASIKEWGWTTPVLVDEGGEIIAGHGRVLAARKLGIDEIPTMTATGWTKAQKQAYVLADNQLPQNAGWDMDLLSVEMKDLDTEGFDLSLIGFGDDMLANMLVEETAGLTDEEIRGSLADRFGVPPFSVLNAREGWWQDRKRAWISKGIKSEVGREIDPTSVSKNPPAYMAGRGNNEGGSIFDPVLCELAYRWFSPPGGLVLDPFAGGSVRGIVAAELGREYIGYELRNEQVSANQVQADEICSNTVPTWVNGDSQRISLDIEADMVFSCPPYADLEVYSDDERDLSTMPYEEFIKAYSKIIKKACGQLKSDRFAVFVVGEVRAKNGAYYNFVGDTVKAFLNAGMEYYNEMILVTAVGSLPIRAGRQFEAGRKIGKTHQNVLVFVKGDGKKATTACGSVEFKHTLEAIDNQSGSAGLDFA